MRLAGGAALQDAPRAGDMAKAGPMCRETIKVGALKCKHCGEVFGKPAGATQ
jgi:hypothetical protein